MGIKRDNEDISKLYTEATKTRFLPPATKWEIYSFEDVVDLAFERDDIEITNEKELIDYLKNRKDNYFEINPDGTYSILFA